jgi:hypothetical protein
MSAFRPRCQVGCRPSAPDLFSVHSLGRGGEPVQTQARFAATKPAHSATVSRLLVQRQAACRRHFPRHFLHGMTTPAMAIIAAAAWQVICTASLHAGSSERPNLIFILADDMGYGDVGCYNPESKIPTPNLDRLARQGVRLTDAHSPSAVCTPTRYGILTGRYCWRTWLKRGVVGGYTPPLIEPHRTTAASFLRQHGYRTACIGKWHLGVGWTRQNGFVGTWENAAAHFEGSWQDGDPVTPTVAAPEAEP